MWGKQIEKRYFYLNRLFLQKHINIYSEKYEDNLRLILLIYILQNSPDILDIYLNIIQIFCYIHL